MKSSKASDFTLALVRDTGLVGASLAGHAIADAVIVMCGTVGCKAKITRPLAFHDRKGDFAARFAWSEFSEHEVVTGDLERLKRAILGQWERLHPGVILVVMTPLIRTVGLEISSYVLALRRSLGIPVYVVDGTDSGGTVMQGYQGVMRTIVAALDWSRPASKLHSVNIWGYPFDRYEGDHLGNVDVLYDLLASMGIRAEAIFFSGKSMADLQNASRAGVNLLLPLAHGLKSEIERISGRRCVCIGLPVGEDSTVAWMREVALAVYQDKVLAGKLVAQAASLFAIKRRDHKAMKVSNILAIVDECWVSTIAEVMNGLGHQKATIAIRDMSSLTMPKVINKKIKICKVKTRQDIRTLVGDRGFDLIIASDRELDLIVNDDTLMKVRFGFPQYRQHFLVKSPFIGPNGLKCFKKSSNK